MNLLEKLFKLEENNTDVRTELLAGLTTFMTMAYILAVNPSVLSAAGMDVGAVFTATALSAFFGTLVMALLANYPFALAPGMGLNAFFAYTVVGQMGYSWQVALTAVFVEGILFFLLSMTKIREAIFNCIPPAIKFGVTGGIGLFIAFIGLQNAKIVVDGVTLVQLYPFKAALESGEFYSTGIGAILALLGLVLTAILMVKQVRGSIMFGIFGTWAMGIVAELIGLYVPNPELGMYSVLPDFSKGLYVPSLAPTFMQMDFNGIWTLDFFTIMFAFMFVDLFDTLGVLIGVASKANMLDHQGRLPRIKGALLADSIATTAGAVMGTSTVTTFVESSAGVMEGGRTGLAAVSSALLFLISLWLAPIFLAIPAFATAPALILVGYLMLSTVLSIDFDDLSESIPAFIAVIAMPFMYSISEGISLGIISYVVINIISGKASKKNISGVMYVLALVFLLKYVLL